MRHSERIAPVAAVVSALSTLLCCLPLGFVTAAGAASLGVASTTLRPWLLGLSAILLAFGFWQLYSARRACRRSSPLSLAVFWLSVVAIAGGLLFPQTLASILAGSWTRGGHAELTELDAQSLGVLKSAFNDASTRPRIILLLSPT